MTSIITMLGQMKNMVLESITNNNRIKEVSPTLRSLETTVEQQTVESTEEITTYGNQMNQLMHEMASKLNDCDGAMKTIDTNATQMIDVNREKDDEMIDHVNTMHATFGKQKNQMSSQLDEMLNEIGDINEMTEINIDAGLNKLINECGDEQERIDSSLHQFNEMHANLESIHKDYLDKLTDDIKVCARRLKSFQKEEVKIYEPTGQTPSKRDYSYPRKLVVTSPHAKIIKDYWQQHDSKAILDCSAIISEEERLKDDTLNDASDTMTNLNNSSVILCDSRNINAFSTPYICNELNKLSVSAKTLMSDDTTVICVSTANRYFSVTFFGLFSNLFVFFFSPFHRKGIRKIDGRTARELYTIIHKIYIVKNAHSYSFNLYFVFF